MEVKQDRDELLEQIKNLSLHYNQNVTLRRRIHLDKPKDAFQMLISNQEPC